MRISLVPRFKIGRRLARPWIALAGAFSVLAAVGLTGQFLTSSSASAADSQCMEGTNVGEECHYVNIVTAGPEYNVTGFLSLDTGQHEYDWSEKNPKFTTWWYRYEQGKTPIDKMNISITVQGSDNIGLTKSWPPSEDHCFLITTLRQIQERDCPSP